jgi:hypothetical protein
VSEDAVCVWCGVQWCSMAVWVWASRPRATIEPPTHLPVRLSSGWKKIRLLDRSEPRNVLRSLRHPLNVMVLQYIRPGWLWQAISVEATSDVSHFPPPATGPTASSERNHQMTEPHGLLAGKRGRRRTRRLGSSETSS